MVIAPVEICFQDITIYHFVVRLLQSKEQQDRITQVGRVALFTGYFDKGIHIACPYLGITASRIEPAANHRTGHTVDHMETLIGKDFFG